MAMKNASASGSSKDLYLRSLKGRAEIYGLVGRFDAGMNDLQTASRVTKSAATKAEIDLLIANNLIKGPCAYRRAENIIQKVLRSAAAAGSLKLHSQGLMTLGEVYLLLGNYQLTQTCVRRALPVMKKINDWYGYARIYHNLGVAQEKLGAYDAAMKYLQQALTESIRHKLILYAGYVCNEIGLLCQEESKFDQAAHYYKRALANAQKAGDKRLAAAIQGNMGIIYASNNDFSKALVYFNHYLAACREMGFLRGYGSVSGNIGSILLQMGDTRAALRYMNEHLSIATKIGFKNDISLASYNLGLVYCVRGDWNRARAAHGRSLTVAQSLRDKSSIGFARLGLAQVDIETRRLQPAEKNLKAASKCFSAIADKVRLALIQYHRAQIEMARDRPERALALARRAQASIAGTVEQDIEINCLRMIGIARLNLARRNAADHTEDKTGLAEAEEHLIRSQQNSQKMGLCLEAAKSQVELYRLYLIQGRTREARKNLTEARKIFIKAQARPALAEIRDMSKELKS